LFVEDNAATAKTAKQIFNSNGQLQLQMTGTKFQQAVWKELLKIPAGTTISYAEMARRIKNPKAVRAVGTACGANPVPLLVPCHRVISSSGGLGGFGGGLPLKQKLLEAEKAA
jgi:O-6-methylguanine DNA methyltransferase